MQFFFILYVTTELSDLVIFWKKKKKNRLSFFQWSVKEANIELQQKKMVYCSMNHDELQLWSGKKNKFWFKSVVRGNDDDG